MMIFIPYPFQLFHCSIYVVLFVSLIPTGIFPSGRAVSEEFKVHLCNASGCALGRYLRTCRVKVIDSDTFPSSKYEEQLLRGKKGVNEIRTLGLLWEYWKLCFLQLPGIGKRSCLVVFLDQFRHLDLFLWVAYFVCWLFLLLLFFGKIKTSQNHMLDGY